MKTSIHQILCLFILLTVAIAAEADNIELSTMSSKTILLETDSIKAVRKGRHFIIELKQTHQVLSTSDVNGGVTENLRYLVNFKSVEANGHQDRFTDILNQTKVQYHQELARVLDIDAREMASMGTAANINNMVHIQKRFRDTTVDAFVTAGVKDNAMRAGDTARWFQGEDGNQFIKDAGTINIILMVNRRLTPGALVKAASVLTEAKSAALSELAIPSKQSSHLATGTGTDQYAIASPIESQLGTLESASGHLKLGELIGDAVREAVVEAIGLQNGLERVDTRSVLHALGRFGLSEKSLLQRLDTLLSDDSFKLLTQNKRAVLSDPKIVATAYAYAAILDRLQYQSLSKHIAYDVLLDQAVNTAIATSDKSLHWQRYRDQLSSIPDDELDLFVHAIAIGWSDRWAK